GEKSGAVRSPFRMKFFKSGPLGTRLRGLVIIFPTRLQARLGPLVIHVASQRDHYQPYRYRNKALGVSGSHRQESPPAFHKRVGVVELLALFLIQPFRQSFLFYFGSL